MEDASSIRVYDSIYIVQLFPCPLDSQLLPCPLDSINRKPSLATITLSPRFRSLNSFTCKASGFPVVTELEMSQVAAKKRKLSADHLSIQIKVDWSKE